MKIRRRCRRTARVKRVRRVDQVSEVEVNYYIVKEGGEDVRLHVHSFDMRWYLRAELIRRTRLALVADLECP